MSEHYAPETMTHAAVQALHGATVLDFGSNGCGYCRAAAPLIEDAFGAFPGVRHLKVEDGRGRPLGRAYGVKLWPTLVFLRDGREVARVVRPEDAQVVRDALEAVAAG